MTARANDQHDERSHWNAYAARWRLVGEPLRPGPEDLRHLQASVARFMSAQPAGAGPRRALLLGVTAEIAELSWPVPLQLLAVDKSPGMVNAVWPGDTPERRAEVGDWFTLPARQRDFALVVGDGVFSLFAYPHQYAELAQVLGQLTQPGGLLSLRLFCRPARVEPVDEVFEALLAGGIGNFHVFKWRLAMALQGDATRGVRLADIWDTFQARVPSIVALAERTGWPEPVIGAIEGYRAVQDRYSFSTELEVVEQLSPYFDLLEAWRPRYELGERCPHLTFGRRA